MPEGDTVFKLARRLDRGLRGQRLTHADLRVPRLATRELAGRTVAGHATYGKHLLTRLVDPGGGPPVTLHSHLLMDGEWRLTGKGRRLSSGSMHQVRVVLTTASGTTAWGLRLHRLDLVPTDEEHRLVGHLGPDPLHAGWDPDEAVRRLCAAPGTPLVSALLDQRNLAGLGNLWVNEVAFLSGASPWTPVGEVDVGRLVERAASALRRSAISPGAYQVTTGLTDAGDTHWVFGRQGRACLRCGTGIEMAREIENDPANRRTWWCPHCQPGPGPEGRAARRTV